MRWASGVSLHTDLDAAVGELEDQLVARLGDQPDLVLAFVTPQYEEQYAGLGDLIAGRLSPALWLGCTATGVVGGGREVEDRPAVAVAAAILPDVEMTPFHLEAGDLPDLDAGPEHWHEALGLDPVPTPHFILFADPTGSTPFDPRPLLMGLDFAYPGSTKIGGLASVLRDNRLFLDGEILSGGCVGVALRGAVEVDTVVAQGCRPIGRPMTVTDCSGYYLTGLDERPAVEVLVELYHELAEPDQELLQRSLHLGVATTALKPAPGHGDFLIRNVLHLDHEKGVIAVGDLLRRGQTVQFHLRDPAAASLDLDQMLQRYRRQPRGSDPSGALLFTCTGRGHHLFGRPDHDTGLFAQAVGDVPVSGFFCGGEIGPVGDATYLHGFTSSFAIFRPPPR